MRVKENPASRKGKRLAGRNPVVTWQSLANFLWLGYPGFLSCGWSNSRSLWSVKVSDGLGPLLRKLVDNARDGVTCDLENGLFDFLDGVYSYLSIYLFSIYLMLSNHYELRTELFLIQTILLSMVYSNLGAVIVLPVTAFLTLMITGVHFQKMNSVAFRNPYLHLGIGLAVLDLTCFFLAVTYEYNYLHAVHHLIAFNLPIVVDRYVETLRATAEPQAIQLESPVIIPVLRI
jgi:hypothetical protein